MAFGNRTLKFDTLAIANPTASASVAQQEVRASDLSIDPSILETGSLNLIGAGMVDVGNFEPINPSEEPPIVEQPSTESPTDETPTDDSGEVEEPLADAQPETEQTEPEYQPEEEAKTNISGGTTEIGFPAWFENSLKKGGMIAGLGVLGFIGYKVADATGVIDKITEKKPAAKTTQKKDEMKAETFGVETVERGWMGDNLPSSREERLRDLKEELKYLVIMRKQLQRLYNSLIPFTTGMVGHLPRMKKKMSDMFDYVEPMIRHYNQLIDETQEKINRFDAETFDAETFNAPMLMCGDCGGDRFVCRECGYCPDCYCDVDCFDQKNPNPVLMKEKIMKSLRGEIKDLQNEKMKLEEYMDYNFTPPAMWEYDLHEQKSIEPFFPQRLSRMNKFYQKELDRISDINAQIEDLISYLEWIDEFYGTREE